MCLKLIRARMSQNRLEGGIYNRLLSHSQAVQQPQLPGSGPRLQPGAASLLPIPGITGTKRCPGHSLGMGYSSLYPAFASGSFLSSTPAVTSAARSTLGCGRCRGAMGRALRSLPPHSLTPRSRSASQLRPGSHPLHDPSASSRTTPRISPEPSASLRPPGRTQPLTPQPH